MTFSGVLLALVGGALIGLASAALLVFKGRIAGVSGIAGGLFSSASRADFTWRVLFVLGLVAGGIVARSIAPSLFATALTRSTAALVVAGLLVGLGTRIANGCTSGHGVCGTSRLSRRSLAATGIFMASGALVVLAVRALAGGVV